MIFYAVVERDREGGSFGKWLHSSDCAVHDRRTYETYLEAHRKRVSSLLCRALTCVQRQMREP